MAKQKTETVEITMDEQCGDLSSGRIDDKAVQMALRTAETPNVMTAHAGAVVCGGTIWLPACEDLLRLCQGVINSVYEHRHLRGGLVLLIVRDKASDAEAMAAGKSILGGKGVKATPQMRLMSRIGRGLKVPADFVVWINQAWMEYIHAVEKDADGVWRLCRDAEPLRKVFALLDHELCHCGAKITGEYIEPGEVDDVVQDLGPRHLSTEWQITNEDGGVLVRSYKKPEVGEYVFCGRKHDLEEFNGVICRHGAWSRNLQVLVDEIAARSPLPLFDGSAETTKKARAQG